MKPNKRLLFICIAAPLIVGGVSALLTRQGMQEFESLNQPPLTPPMWLFPIAWTILYTLMGISTYLVLQSQGNRAAISGAMKLYGFQLAVNFLWPTFFFNFQWYAFSFLWLLFLWLLVFFMIRRFVKVRPVAGYMNVPYLVWLTFAAYLNFGVWQLN